MGWNSWDCYGASVTEKEVRSNADFMQKRMKAHGWKYVVVDIRWHVDDAGDYNYNFTSVKHNFDENGVLVPSLERFPSATDRTFKGLARDIHPQGLLFGVHLMRGIDKLFYDKVSKSKEIGRSGHTFSELKVVNNGASWLPDNYGVEQTEAGQAWYDLAIATYASWGIDFIKVDDLSYPYQRGEVEMLHNAIMKVYRETGHKIVLSTSPGPAPLDSHTANHLKANADMWRVTGDMWDKWDDVYAIFQKAKAWTPYRTRGTWPDNDMLALGTIGIRTHDFWLPVQHKRDSALTDDEEKSLLSLWMITRSPLMFGGDWTMTKPSMIDMLSNDEVLAVNQASENGREVSRVNDLVVWTADKPRTRSKYVALFNARDTNFTRDRKAAWESGRLDREGQTVDVNVDVRGARRMALVVNDGGDGFEFDHAAWIKPTLRGSSGEIPLTSIKWSTASSGWGMPHVDRTCEDKPLVLGGREVSGIGTHANSLIVFDLPDGCETFTATAALTNHGSVQFSVIVDRGDISNTNEVTVNFRDLGRC